MLGQVTQLVSYKILTLLSASVIDLYLKIQYATSPCAHLAHVAKNWPIPPKSACFYFSFLQPDLLPPF